MQLRRTDEQILRVTGDVDLGDAVALTEAIQASALAAGEVLVDLSGVTFMGSSGLHAIADGVAAVNGSASVVLVDIPSSIVRIIEIVGLDRMNGIQLRNGERV